MDTSPITSGTSHQRPPARVGARRGGSAEAWLRAAGPGGHGPALRPAPRPRRGSDGGRSPGREAAHPRPAPRPPGRPGNWFAADVPGAERSAVATAPVPYLLVIPAATPSISPQSAFVPPHLGCPRRSDRRLLPRAAAGYGRAGWRAGGRAASRKGRQARGGEAAAASRPQPANGWARRAGARGRGEERWARRRSRRRGKPGLVPALPPAFPRPGSRPGSATAPPPSGSASNPPLPRASSHLRPVLGPAPSLASTRSLAPTRPAPQRLSPHPCPAPPLPAPASRPRPVPHRPRPAPQFVFGPAPS